MFRPWKTHLFHYSRALKYTEEPWFFFSALFPAIAVKSRQEYLATLTSWSRNVTTSTREPTTRAWIHDVRMAQFVLKIEKLSHVMGPRESQDLRSPSPIMAPVSERYHPKMFRNNEAFVFVSFPQKRNGIVFSSGVNYLHSRSNIQSELSL